MTLDYRKLFGRPEPSSSPEPIELIEGRDEEYWKGVQAEVDAEPPLALTPLPPYDHDAPCPKCRFMAGTTDFHGGYHEDCSIPESPWRPIRFPFGKPSRQEDVNYARFVRRTRSIPEHFDRACPNCKHQWAESIVEP